jgi:hypothetical protein
MKMTSQQLIAALGDRGFTYDPDISPSDLAGCPNIYAYTLVQIWENFPYLAFFCGTRATLERLEAALKELDFTVPAKSDHHLNREGLPLQRSKG